MTPEERVRAILELSRFTGVDISSQFIRNTKDHFPAAGIPRIHNLVEKKGPDDPRNGLSLCKRHHWAFDNGLFTITDARQVKVSPSVHRAEQRRFDLEENMMVKL